MPPRPTPFAARMRWLLAIVVLLLAGAPAAQAAVSVTASATTTLVSVGYTWSAPDTPNADPVLTFEYVSGGLVPAGSQWKYTVGTPASSPVTVTAFDPGRPATSTGCSGGNCLKTVAATPNGTDWLPDGTYSVSIAITSAGGTTTATAPSTIVVNGPTQPPRLTSPTASAGATGTALTLSYTLPEAPGDNPVVRFTGTGSYGTTDCSLSRVYLQMGSDQSVTTTIPYATPGSDSAGKVVAASGRVDLGPPEVSYPPTLIPGCQYAVTLQYIDVNPSHGPAQAVLSSLTLPPVVVAPSGVTATAVSSREGAVLVQWSGQSTRALTRWEVTTSPASAGCTTTSISATSCTIGDLTPGTPYAFTVTTVDADGVSRSAAGVAATPIARPSAPSNVRVPSVAASSATVAWDAAAANGSAVTGYTVTASPGAGTCTTAGTSCEVAGLVAGQQYTFTVVATNSAGTSVASQPTASTLVGAVPGAPLGVAATAGDGAATVSWSAPSANGSAITTYSVESDPPGGSCTVSAPATSCSVGSLVNGTSYRFRVKATNGFGAGAWSEWSWWAATAAGTPGAVSGISVSPSPGMLAVSWATDAAGNGAAVTGYRVTTVPSSDGCYVAAPARGCVLSGLTDGTAYAITITPENAVGAGTVATTSGTPGGRPGAPGGVTALALSGGRATVAWSTPASSALPIIRYIVTASPGGASCQATPPAMTCTVNGLLPGAAYAFSVVALNDAGTGARSAPTVPTTAAWSTQAIRRVVGSRMTSLAVAGRAGIAAPPGARIGVRVTSGRRVCQLRGGGLVMLRPGSCRLSISVPTGQAGMVRRTARVVSVEASR